MAPFLKVVIVLVVVYLFISVCVAIQRLNRYAKFERGTYDVPRGDRQYFQPPRLFGPLTTVFYPSIWLIILWLKIAGKLND